VLANKAAEKIHAAGNMKNVGIVNATVVHVWGASASN
jgi:hypothetical protein